MTGQLLVLQGLSVHYGPAIIKRETQFGVHVCPIHGKNEAQFIANPLIY